MSFELFTVAAPGLRHALDQSLSVLRERERKTPITQCHGSFGVRLSFPHPTRTGAHPQVKKKKESVQANDKLWPVTQKEKPFVSLETTVLV